MIVKLKIRTWIGQVTHALEQTTVNWQKTPPHRRRGTRLGLKDGRWHACTVVHVPKHVCDGTWPVFTIPGKTLLAYEKRSHPSERFRMSWWGHLSLLFQKSRMADLPSIFHPEGLNGINVFYGSTVQIEFVDIHLPITVRKVQAKFLFHVGIDNYDWIFGKKKNCTLITRRFTIFLFYRIH